MKNLKYTAILAALALAGCQDDNLNLDFTLPDPSTLELNAVTEKSGSLDGNKIILDNHSPLLAEWVIGETSLRGAHVEYATPFTGKYDIVFKGHKAGVDATADRVLTVNVDTISTITKEMSDRLCIGVPGAPTYFGTTCDPSEIEYSIEGQNLTVKNPNPVYTDWECGGVTLDKNVGVMKMKGSGEFPLNATFTMANGTQITQQLGTVVVKQFDVPQIVLDLVGEHGEKTWVFADSNKFGLGGYNASFGPDYAAFDDYMSMFSAYLPQFTGEESGSMTFNIDGNFSVAPTGRTGQFEYDFDETVGVWSVGKLKVTEPILYGFAMALDEATQTPAPSYMPKEFFIVKCDAENLVLAASAVEGAPLYDWGHCTFWCFKAGAQSPMAGKSQLEKNLMGENGTKKWQFDDSNKYGLGGYNASFGPDYAAFDDYMSMFSAYLPQFTGEESGTITFNVDGNFSVTPTGRSGQFEYDFDDTVGVWSVGKLKVTEPILYGFAMALDEATQTPAPSYMPTEFFIVKCEPDKLILATSAVEGAPLYDWGHCTFWCFKPAE